MLCFADSRLHHIADTHVTHHLFSNLPFYNAREATAHIRSVIGPYYLYDPTPVPVALWRVANACHFIEDDEKVCWFKKSTGVGYAH